MKKLTTVVFLFGMFIGFGLEQAQAQTRIDVGPRIGYDIAGNVEEFFLGADGRFTLSSLPVLLDGTFDWYFADVIDFWQLSFNALYEFGVDNQRFTPYAGLGLGLSRASRDLGANVAGDSTTDVGLNIIGGATLGSGNLKPYAQAQITFGDFDLFTLGVGLLINVSGERR